MNLHFPQPRGPQRRQFQAINLPNADVVSACADMVVRAGESQGPRVADAWVPQRVDDDEWPEVWTRDPARMASEEERKTQQEIAQQAAVAAAQKGSSSVTWP